MKTLLRALLFSGLVLVLLGAACAVGAWLFGGYGDAVTLSIDDNGVTLPLHAGGWMAAGAGVLLSMAIVLVVVPLSLVIGLGLPAIVMAGLLALGLFLLFGTIALLCSPLLLPLLFVAWLVRRDRRAMRRASTTIA